MSDEQMKPEYDFSRGRRGLVLPLPPGKERITIRLDSDILDWFRSQASAQGGGNYQTMINQVLRAFIESHQVESFIFAFSNLGGCVILYDRVTPDGRIPHSSGCDRLRGTRNEHRRVFAGSVDQ